MLDAAVDVVGKARNDKLTQMLTNYLMGDTDGVPKDPNYIYKLHMALENHTEAAKAAMAIAIKQQKLGNYQVLLFIFFPFGGVLVVRVVESPYMTCVHSPLPSS